jgi:hypothetical protein
MGFLRRNRKTDEARESRCAFCREPLPEDAVECNMCGAPAMRLPPKPVPRRDQNADGRMHIR